MEFLNNIQHRTASVPLCPNRRKPRRFFGARNLFRLNSGSGRAADCFADADRVPGVKRTEVRAPLTAASPAWGFSRSTLASSLAGRPVRAWLILLVILLGAGVFAAPLRAQAFKEYDVKAAFLYHLAEFVDWPAEAFPAAENPLVIGVLGADPFGKSLDNLVQGLSEGVCAQDPDDEGILRGRKGLRGPINELSQVVKERGLDVVFLEGLGSKRRGKNARPQENDKQNQPGTHGPASKTGSQ